LKNKLHWLEPIFEKNKKFFFQKLFAVCGLR